MKSAILLLLMMFLLVVPSFSVESINLKELVHGTEKTKSLFGEEVTVQNKRYSENAIIHISDIVGIKPEKITIGKVSRTYSKSIEIGNRLVNSKKMIKARGHPNMYYKNKIG